ncbi:hypothetical protein [Marivirga harenae]|uniref:hypothetical protein n=1 Tax=Marivirga harenae TaxID=2010992 RepID=UPI0026E0A7FB|nr:hypothetical protein [Marivirga harenae]WKV11335.1 hypothetical protein Q3Y49_14090 [Marivirga harenae]
MNFTNYEHTVIKELEKRAGDVLYLKDIAPFFIFKSCLQISTYTQTAFIQVGDNMQAALSEYFQLIVFIKKLEEGFCYSIPYTPLEDNSVQIGNNDFEEYQQHTIADGDLLIQLFSYSAKKYVIAPNASDQFYQKAKQSNINLIIPSIILLLLFLFIGAIGYQSYLDNNSMRLKQEAIRADLKEQKLKIGLLSERFESHEQYQKEVQKAVQNNFKVIKESLQEQNHSLMNIKYWNQQQYNQLTNLYTIIRDDSID